MRQISKKNAVKVAWEKRSKLYGTKPEGVLPKSLPPIVNSYLDDWMYSHIKSSLKKLPKNKRLKVLDLGAGYGRLSKRVLEDFPKSATFGIDVAKHYVKLYNQNLGPRGKASVGDIKKLNYKDNFFDCVFLVTTLMYLDKPIDQQKAISELIRVLKPGGVFIIIERNPGGQNIITLGGLGTKLRGTGKKEINSVSFSPKYLSGLITNSGGKIKSRVGMPFFTFAQPFFVFGGSAPKFIHKSLLDLIKPIDVFSSSVLTPSLYIAYSGQKK